MMFIGHGEELLWSGSIGSRALTTTVNKLARPTFKDILWIQADGAELENIRQQFPFMTPLNNQKSVTWYGNFARFIIANVVMHKFTLSFSGDLKP